MDRKIKIVEIPKDKDIEDYPEGTVFVLDDDDPMADDSYWAE